eukprot:gene34856-46824_t
MTFSDDYSAYSSQFSSIFSQLKDPRRTGKGNIKYPLTEILFLAVSSVLCGYTDFVCIEEFGELNLAWLRKYYPYSNGTCSHDVIGKLFQRLNYQQFSECFMQWARLSYKFNTEELIAIDGKRVCGSYDTASATPASHIVSAYASAGEICIGQVVTEEKSNEITAIPELLDSIDLRSAIVSIDAMGCQRDIAEKIISKKADYILAVKANQKYLYDDVVDLFASKQPFKSHSAVETGHGRIEKRTATVLDSAAMLDDSNKWPGLRSLAYLNRDKVLHQQLHGVFRRKNEPAGGPVMTRDKADLLEENNLSIPAAPETAAPPEDLEDLALGDDYALNPEYVDMVIDAADRGDAERLRELVGALRSEAMAEHGGKVSSEEKTAIETAITDLKAVLEGGDSDEIAVKTKALIDASMKLGEAMYKAQQGDAGSDAGDQPSDDGVVDAEFEEVDGDDKKSA